MCDHSNEIGQALFSCGVVWTQEGMKWNEVTSFQLNSIFEQWLDIVPCSVWWTLFIFFIVIRQRYWPSYTNPNFTCKIPVAFVMNVVKQQQQQQQIHASVITTNTLQLQRFTKRLAMYVKVLLLLLISEKRNQVICNSPNTIKSSQLEALQTINKILLPFFTKVIYHLPFGVPLSVSTAKLSEECSRIVSLTDIRRSTGFRRPSCSATPPGTRLRITITVFSGETGS